MRVLLLFAFASSIVACVDEDPSEGTTTQTVVTNNKLVANKLVANKLVANKLVANKLVANKLVANKLVANLAAVGDLLNTEDGREVLSYIISCAIPEGVIIVATAADGTVYEFPGEVGLVKSWIHHPVNEEGKSWISACLFARVNAHDVSVPVSLRGPHHALVVTPEEAAGWPLEEGAFYGQFFTPGDDPIIWIACRGRDQAAGETGGLVERDCAEPDPADPTKTQCGFDYAGDCADFAPPPNAFACKDFSNHGFYVDCFDGPVVTAHHHRHHHHHEFRQVITTFVTP